MLTGTQITAGAARLVSGKLTANDVDQAASILSMDSFFGGLISVYGYSFKTKLAAFDDNVDEGHPAAQIAACLIKMEELGFGVAAKQGGPTGVFYKEKDEYWQYVQVIFLKMYTLPQELAKYPRSRSNMYRGVSSTVMTRRVEGSMDIDTGSEAAMRRGYSRRRGW